jgi:hypothetical protein
MLEALLEAMEAPPGLHAGCLGTCLLTSWKLSLPCLVQKLHPRFYVVPFRFIILLPRRSHMSMLMAGGVLPTMGDSVRVVLCNNDGPKVVPVGGCTAGVMPL